MVRVAKMIAIAIAIVIVFQAADAAKIVPAIKISKQEPFNYNLTTGAEHHSQPQARTLCSDGEGTYIGSNSVHFNTSGGKCWTDYFVVQQGLVLDEWAKASGNLYCTGTSTCQFQHMDGNPKGQTWSIAIDPGMQAEITNFGVQGGFKVQDFNTGTDTTSCTWSDGKCHCIWTQQELLRQNGYTRRRCLSNNGDVTVWMQDWVHDIPTRNVNYGCGSKYTDT